MGSLVEFEHPEQIRDRYPGGVRDLADGGAWDTVAGQPTDDSEMARSLARLLVRLGRHEAAAARKAYVKWLNSGPFDCGFTISSGLRGHPYPDSQGNGAMMRISPLGIFGAGHPFEDVAGWAARGAQITHPNPVCKRANALFAIAIADAVRSGPSPEQVHKRILDRAKSSGTDASLVGVIRDSAEGPPDDYVRLQGWVRIAIHNALWLLHAARLAEAAVNKVMRGGDPDTNAAICGALLGAAHGRQAVPQRSVECLLHCRPAAGRRGVRRPRPERF